MLVALILPGSLVNIWAGHYGFLVGALALYGWRWLDTHPRRAGIIFGIMTIKPHLGVLVALVLLLRRDWTAIGWAAATRSEEHTSELQSLMRISYAVFCLKNKTDE